jgi:methyl-accepting chemotaxis protein
LADAENAQQANSYTASTQEVADRGGAVVSKAVDAMARIEESSRKISDIISVIGEIARQTHLLELNAAVEAARRGGPRVCGGGVRGAQPGAARVAAASTPRP